MARLSAIQLHSTSNVAHNLATIEQQLSALVLAHPNETDHLVLLPECCLLFGVNDQAQLSFATEQHFEHSLKNTLAEMAKKYHVYLVAGTIAIAPPKAKKYTNRCTVFSPKGELIAYYDKIHLFDVDVQDSAKQYRESALTKAGNKVVLTELGFARLGLSICYDLRFPELYRHLAVMGADIITVPSAFTQVTGQAHWQPLLQARAIENQVYIVAANQQGTHENNRQTWGHTMIICPWGEILTCQDVGEGFISTPYRAELIKKVRSNMPVIEHSQFTTEIHTYE